MVKKDKIEFFDVDDDETSKVVDFKSLIFLQMNRTAITLSKSQTEEEVQLAEQALEVLEGFAIGYYDKKYREHLKEIKAKHKGILDKLTNAQKQNSKLMLHLKLNYLSDFWKILNQLLSRGGITLIRDLIDEIGGK